MEQVGPLCAPRLIPAAGSGRRGHRRRRACRAVGGLSSDHGAAAEALMIRAADARALSRWTGGFSHQGATTTWSLGARHPRDDDPRVAPLLPGVRDPRRLGPRHLASLHRHPPLLDEVVGHHDVAEAPHGHRLERVLESLLGIRVQRANPTADTVLANRLGREARPSDKPFVPKRQVSIEVGLGDIDPVTALRAARLPVRRLSSRQPPAAS